MSDIKAGLEKFKKEHVVKGFMLDSGSQGMRYRMDGDSYTFKPLYCGYGMGSNFPSGYEVFRKRRGVDKVRLFEYYEFVNSESTADTIRYCGLYDEVKEAVPDIGYEDSIPYVIWIMMEEKDLL